jgi:hypothetical protein
MILPSSLKYVKENGLTADEDGYIYLLDTKSPEITDTVAINQLMTDAYYIFQVDPWGFSSDLEPDQVAEFTAAHHRRIKQEFIEADYIKLLGKRKVDTNRVQNYTAKETEKLVRRLNSK